jgi:hypothetical protein
LARLLTEAEPIPEPATLLLVGAGAARNSESL